MAPFNIKSLYPSGNSVYFIITLASVVLGRPQNQPQPPKNNSQLASTSSEIPVYNNVTTTPTICPSANVEICHVANKISLLPTAPANATADAMLLARSNVEYEVKSTTAAAAADSSHAPNRHLGHLKNTTAVDSTNSTKELEPMSQKRVDIHYSFFYKTGTMEVVCPSSRRSLQNVKDITRSGPVIIETSRWGVDPDMFARAVNDLKKSLYLDVPTSVGNYNLAIKTTHELLKNCERACKCNKDPQIVPVNANSNVREDRNKNYKSSRKYKTGCATNYQAAICEKVLRCYCRVELDSKKKPGKEYNDQSIYDFAYAIDSIPIPLRTRRVSSGHDVPAWNGWVVDRIRRQVPNQRIGFSVDYIHGRPVPRNSGVLNPRQVAQLRQQQSPAMFGPDGGQLYNPNDDDDGDDDGFAALRTVLEEIIGEDNSIPDPDLEPPVYRDNIYDYSLPRYGGSGPPPYDRDGGGSGSGSDSGGTST
ncbi:hypothetical protein TWF506_010608 [Arthrobotrys conoides]|uniref:Uncharacterized protein n=1 Tax=Arthrobotrys conoides TaxID=74498 RepID=A0AAN8NHT3_9PEZI